MSGQDYIGSKISLISLSDIRYVGTLHSINTNDSTVSLENVRSFGTEGRRGNPDDEVLATDTVFDFVVFRGSDIKDLQVFEAPVKPAAPAPAPAPAPAAPTPPSRPQGMVDPSMRHSLENYPPPPMNPYMMPPYPPQAHHQAMYWQSQMYPGQQQQQQPPPPPLAQHQMQPPPPNQQMPTATPMPAAPASSATSHQQAPAPVSKVAPSTHLQQPLAPPVSSSQPTRTTAEKHVDQQEIDGAAVENLAKKVSELDVDIKETTTEETTLLSTTTSSATVTTTANETTQSSQQRQSYRTNGRQHRQTGHGNANGQPSHHHHRNKQRLDVPQSDFDFESSNAKFSKNDLLKELVKGDDGGAVEGEDDVNGNEHQHQQVSQQEEEVIIPPNDEDFYDKTKSFFDNISCESKERQDQDGNVDRRGKFQEERRLNLETFGQASVDQSRFRNFRGRGGYRGGYRGHRGGGGGAGYYRGGGGNRNYNNRSNYHGYRGQQQQQQQQQAVEPQ